MILSVGTSYEPLVLSLKLMKPKKYYFYTLKIQKQVIKYYRLYC